MRYPVYHPYKKLLAHKEAMGELSLRKEVCLQFLKWGYTVEAKDKDAFIELLKVWRNQENRIGQPRTLLERKGRKFFQQARRHKALAPTREGARKWATRSKELGIGVHSEEYKATIKERNLRINKMLAEKELNGVRKNWIVYSPDGEVFRVRGLNKLCREKNLDNRHLRRTTLTSRHKGWWAERVDDEWNSFHEGG